jgi:hypothetical protein
VQKEKRYVLVSRCRLVVLQKKKTRKEPPISPTCFYVHGRGGAGGRVCWTTLLQATVALGTVCTVLYMVLRPLSPLQVAMRCVVVQRHPQCYSSLYRPAIDNFRPPIISFVHNSTFYLPITLHCIAWIFPDCMAAARIRAEIRADPVGW